MKPYFIVKISSLPTITMTNIVRIPAPNAHFRRTPTEYILYIIHKGTMSLNEGGIEYTLQRGDVLLLDPTRCHFGNRTNHEIQYSYIHFVWDALYEQERRESEYGEWLQTKRQDSIANTSYQAKEEDLLIIPKYFHIEAADFVKIERLVDHLSMEFHHCLEYRQSIVGCQLITLLIEMSHMLTNKFVKGFSGSNQLSMEIITYLREHYAEKIDRQEIADYCHGNYDYINRRFKQGIGKTIFQYLNEYRIEMSKTMLHSGIYTLNQIAEQCGFCNEFYFSKIFKKQVGVSPRAFKAGE